ncbi:hypothetical protein [Thermosporothrix hazakensis]|nr:hypothetical protein [Thermosporothrix hazakensis]
MLKYAVGGVTVLSVLGGAGYLIYERGVKSFSTLHTIANPRYVT